MKKFYTFLLFIITSFLVEVFASFFVKVGMSKWYQGLVLPPYMPQTHFFPIIWIVLYFLIGLAGAVLWIHRNAHLGKISMFFWFIQLGLNALWPICFFFLKNPWLGAIELSLLYIVSFLTMVYSFSSERIRPAGWLFIPYVLWLTFALYLNWAIVILN